MLKGIQTNHHGSENLFPVPSEMYTVDVIASHYNSMHFSVEHLLYSHYVSIKC